MAILRKCHVVKRINDIINNRQDSLLRMCPVLAVQRPTGKSLHSSDDWGKLTITAPFEVQSITAPNTWWSYSEMTSWHRRRSRGTGFWASAT